MGEIFCAKVMKVLVGKREGADKLVEVVAASGQEEDVVGEKSGRGGWAAQEGKPWACEQGKEHHAQRATLRDGAPSGVGET